jgi:hypothetical protein
MKEELTEIELRLRAAVHLVEHVRRGRIAEQFGLVGAGDLTANALGRLRGLAEPPTLAAEPQRCDCCGCVIEPGQTVVNNTHDGPITMCAPCAQFS